MKCVAFIIGLLGITLWGVSATHAREPGCMPHLARAPIPFLHKAALAHDQVGLTFIGHSTFLIESPKGVRIATDFNDHIRPQTVPDIVTMNKAHSTHYSSNLPPGITHILRGWTPDGSRARHDVTLLDVHVRNVATHIRSAGSGTQDWGNSIFVFEMAGLCIAHLGHLHHTLEPWDLQQFGRIDVVLAPVDGSWTLDVEGMIEVLRALQSPLVIPMHYFGENSLQRFLDRAAEHYTIERRPQPSLILSRDTLPARPTLVVLPGQ